MRKKSFAIGCCIVVFYAAPAFAEHCRPGRATITQYVDKLEKTETGWGVLGAADAVPCQVNLIRGEGAIPAQCRNAKKVTATGTVTHLLGMSFLRVSKIQCE
jgi:hypothetical protein